jgi:hypothetical protein
MENYRKFIWGTMVLVIVIITIFFVIYFSFIKKSPLSPPSNTINAVTESQSPSPQIQAVQTPDLQNDELQGPLSDKELFTLIKQCSTGKEFAKWVNSKHAVHKFVTIVDNISNGESPTPHLDFLPFPKKFTVIKKNDTIILDPQSYSRYNLATETFLSLKTEKIAFLFQNSKYRIAQAFKELGYPNDKFEDSLSMAITYLLETPVLEGDILLEEGVTSYRFKNPRLEHLNPAQKHFFRMGPKNIKKIKLKIKELALGIGIPEISHLPGADQ